MDKNNDFGVSIDSCERDLELRSASKVGDGFRRTVNEVFERVARRTGEGEQGILSGPCGGSVTRAAPACLSGDAFYFTFSFFSHQARMDPAT